MPWFWGSKSMKDDNSVDFSEEYSDEEYTSDELDGNHSDGSDEDESLSCDKSSTDDDCSYDEGVPERSPEKLKTGNGETIRRPPNEIHDPDVPCPTHDPAADRVTPREIGRTEDLSNFEERNEKPYQVNEINPSAKSRASRDPAEANQSVIANPSISSASNLNHSDPDSESGCGKEETTSFFDKQSLLILAAEHNRVDILNAVLTDTEVDREKLMNSGIPPLHIAVSFGSVNAAQSLLRMGADPSVRPDVKSIRMEQKEGQAEIKDMEKFDGASAWELLFGDGSTDGDSNAGRWSIFKSSSDQTSGRKLVPVSMAPSKREGIRHAFTAESLRCIGSDEADRLRQLVDSGMPRTSKIGDNDLYQWSVDMGAEKCQKYLRPNSSVEEDEGDLNETLNLEAAATVAPRNSESSIVLDRSLPGAESVSNLSNRLIELESLGKALSVCLDNLAEEVCVCHGILMETGASALASHVRRLKEYRYKTSLKLEKITREYEAEEKRLTVLMADYKHQEISSTSLSKTIIRPQSGQLENDGASGTETSIDEEDRRMELIANIAVNESKIRKLRVSIADLTEENTRNIEEIERRGLTGGLRLVRALREEIRDIDFNLQEMQHAKAVSEAKLSVLESQLSSRTEILGNMDTNSLSGPVVQPKGSVGQVF